MTDSGDVQAAWVYIGALHVTSSAFKPITKPLFGPCSLSFHY